MVTVPITPAPAPHNSFLQSFGSKFVDVFKWLGTPKAQAGIVAAEVLGETVAHAFNPALAALDPLISTWTMEIFKAQALAAAAGAADGSGAQKAAMVLGSMTPQVIAFAEANKLPAPTGAKLQAANDALVAFLNALEGPPVAA